LHLDSRARLLKLKKMPFPAPNWSYRVGRNQRAVTRALLAYGREFTTAELL
jgi:hypothetical protein